MFPEHLWAAFQFAPWEDVILFHARLFRCLLLGLLDSHSDVVFLSQGAGRMWTVLGQRLADVGLTHDAGRLHTHDPDSHRTRCPPKRRYEATWLPSSPSAVMDQTVPVLPFPSVPHPINVTHGLHDEPDIPGSPRVLGGYSIGVVGCIFLWLFTFAIVVSRSSSVARARSDSTRLAVDSTTNSGKRVIRPLPRDQLPINGATQSLVVDVLEAVGHQVSMPGAWLHEQSMPEESVLDPMPWALHHSCAQVGKKAWAHFSGLTFIFAALNHSLDDVVTVGRKCQDGRFPVCQGLGLDEFDLDVPTAINETEELGAAPDRLPFKFDVHIENLRESNTATHDRRCGLSAMSDVTIRDLDPAPVTTLDIVCGDKNGPTFNPVASSNSDPGPYPEDTSSDSDESASEDGSNVALFGIGTRRAGGSPLERQDAYGVCGRRQDGALPDTGSPLLLRRARSTGYLWRKRNEFDDDDEGTGDDSYWMEQVDARLSGERDSRQALDRSGWSDSSSRHREGREDESDNWRTRGLQVTQSAAPEETSTKVRRYSSPPLNVNVSLSHRAGSGDRSPGIYVVPQKRGPMTGGGRCWSPGSSPRGSKRPSGLGFFPFRKTPPLLTPKAWRPGCLYVPDPPAGESREAGAWWDGLTRGGGHTFNTGTVNQDVIEHPVSWRDRYENDPASRRFASVHRRAMTEG